MIDGLFFSTTLTGRRRGHTPLYKQERKRPKSGTEAVKPDPGSSWEGHSGGVGAGVGDESADACGIVLPLRIPLVIRPLRRTSVVVGRTDEMLCVGYKWVSRYEAPNVCT